MGHLLFFILHIVALLFGWVFLFVTLPAHLIYGVLKSRANAAARNAPNPRTHVKCPACRELVLIDATKCTHCGMALLPGKAPPSTALGPTGTAIIAGILLIGYLVIDRSPFRFVGTRPAPFAGAKQVDVEAEAAATLAEKERRRKVAEETARRDTAVACKDRKNETLTAVKALMDSGDTTAALQQATTCSGATNDPEWEEMRNTAVLAWNKSRAARKIAELKAIPKEKWQERLALLAEINAIDSAAGKAFATEFNALKRRQAAAEAAEAAAAKREAAAEAARRKKEGVRLGMTQEEVLASSWGKPEHINRTTTSSGTHEQWVYGLHNYLYFDDGILTGIQN